MLPFVANAQSKEPACNIGKSLSVVKQDKVCHMRHPSTRHPSMVPACWLRCLCAGFTASSKTDCITKVFHLLFVGGNFSNALQQADFLRRDEAAEKDPTRDASL